MNAFRRVDERINGEIKAGFSTVDMSPCIEGDDVVFRRPLEATCVALVGGEATFVMFGVDFCEFNPAYCFDLQIKIGSALQIPPEHILINTSHTHSAPWDDDSFGTPVYDGLAGILAKGACKAVANAKPARVKAGSTDVGKSLSVHRRGDAGPDLGVQTFWYGYIYRDGDERPDASALANELKSRWLGKESEYKIGPEPIWFDGPVDQLVHAMSFEDMDGNVLGTIVRFSAHAHLASSLQDRVFDPDYPGRVRDAMQAKIGGTCVFLTGPCGNLVPKDKARYKIDPKREPPRPYLGPSSALCSVDDDELMSEIERIGGEIAEAAIKALDGVSAQPLESARLLQKPFAIPLDPALANTKEETELMLERLIPEYEAFLNAGGPLREIRRLANRMNWLRWSGWIPSGFLTREESDGGEKILPVTALALNSTLMIFMTSEVVVETTLAIRQAHPTQDIWTLSLTGGAIGYFPTAQIIDEGGYEGRATIIARDAEEKLCAHVCEMLREMGS